MTHDAAAAIADPMVGACTRRRSPACAQRRDRHARRRHADRRAEPGGTRPTPCTSSATRAPCASASPRFLDGVGDGRAALPTRPSRRCYGAALRARAASARRRPWWLARRAGRRALEVARLGRRDVELARRTPASARRDVVLTFGGGVITDLGGWVASAYMRGVPVRQPADDAAGHGRRRARRQGRRQPPGGQEPARRLPAAGRRDLAMCATCARSTAATCAPASPSAIKKGVIASPEYFAFIEDAGRRAPRAATSARSSGSCRAAAAIKIRADRARPVRGRPPAAAELRPHRRASARDRDGLRTAPARRGGRVRHGRSRRGSPRAAAGCPSRVLDRLLAVLRALRAAGHGRRPSRAGDAPTRSLAAMEKVPPDPRGQPALGPPARARRDRDRRRRDRRDRAALGAAA